jgi:hypothetical protein
MVVGWGFSGDFLLDLPITSVAALIEKVSRREAGRTLERSWLQFYAAQAPHKEMKKVLKPLEKATGATKTGTPEDFQAAVKKWKR